MERARCVAVLLAALAACVPAAREVAVAPLEDGEPCTADGSCRSGECLELHGGPRCGRRCGGDEDCGASEACRLTALGAATTATIGRVCHSASATAAPAMAACGADADCRSGLCEDGRCVALCASRCGPGQRCEPRALEREGASVRGLFCAVRLAEPELELGPVETPLGASAELSFEVPAGTGAFTIVLHDEEGLRVAATSLVAPDGAVLIDGRPETPDPNPGSSYIGTAAVLVPSTDRAEVSARAGRWRLRVGTFDPARFDALVPVAGRIERVLVSLEPPPARGGALDLVLHFAPGTGVAPEGGVDAEPVRRLLGRLTAQLLAPAGLELGEVELRALPAEHDRVEDGDETRALCRARGELGRSGASVNVFIVARLDYTSGHAGGIPGPAGLAHTNASGVVLERLDDWEHTGTLLAHELGHFLGLRHTSELSGGERDPITDTPECPAGTALESCPDYRNLMFPSFPLEDALELTPGQLRVLRGSSFLHDAPR